MAKALIYFASTLMLLLAVSIITNAFVFGKSIATNCGDFTDMRANKPDAVAVTIDTQVNEELTSKLISSPTSTTTTTTRTTPGTTICALFDCLPRSIPTESDSSYESYDYSSEDLWGSDSSSDSRTETEDDSGWGFDWGN